MQEPASYPPPEPAPSPPACSTQHQHKVVIVTGASSGLGQAIALMYAQRGASVTLCGRDEVRLQSTLTSCTEVSGGHADRFITVRGDVRESATRKRIVEETVEKFGRLDILVANAGVSNGDVGIHTATEESYDKVFDTNVKAVFFQIQEAVPHIEKSKGNILVISSNISHFAYPTITYPMTKAAVDHMVRCLATDLGPKGIRVNAVNPGFVPTTRIITRSVPDPKDAEDIIATVSKSEVEKQPLGSSTVTSEAVAEAVSYLTSDAASYVTGQCLVVDAGRRFAY